MIPLEPLQDINQSKLKLNSHALEITPEDTINLKLGSNSYATAIMSKVVKCSMTNFLKN